MRRFLAFELVTTCAVLLGLATPVVAGPTISTPSLFGISGGRVICLVANVSSSRQLEGNYTKFGFDGEIISGPFDFSLSPRSTAALGGGGSENQHCVVEILRGGRKNARVSLVALDASGNAAAAVGAR